MRRLTFIITIMGIFTLFLLLSFSHPITVHSPSELSSLQPNQKVQATGEVLKETQYNNIKYLKLNNSIEIICKSCPDYLNKTISVLGAINKYENKTQIQALRIKLLT